MTRSSCIRRTDAWQHDIDPISPKKSDPEASRKLCFCSQWTTLHKYRYWWTVDLPFLTFDNHIIVSTSVSLDDHQASVDWLRSLVFLFPSSPNEILRIYKITMSHASGLAAAIRGSTGESIIVKNRQLSSSEDASQILSFPLSHNPMI